MVSFGINDKSTIYFYIAAMDSDGEGLLATAKYETAEAAAIAFAKFETYCGRTLDLF